MKPRVFLGVDLIEIEKAALFYKSHRGRLGDIFHPDESRYVRQSRDPGSSCAVILAAKEAVFKAFAFPWMGRQGFRAIRILPGRGRKLSFRFEGRGRRFSGQRAGQSRLSYRKHGDYVVALCVPRGF